MVPEVRMRDELSNEIKNLCVTRDKLVKLWTALKNKMQYILECERHPEPLGGFFERERIGDGFGVSDSIDRESGARSDRG